MRSNFSPRNSGQICRGPLDVYNLFPVRSRAGRRFFYLRLATLRVSQRVPNCGEGNADPMGHRRINGPSQSPPPLLTFPWHVPLLPSPQPLLRNPLHPVTYAPRRDPYNSVSIPVVLVPRCGIDTRRGVVSTCLRFSSIDLASLLFGTVYLFVFYNFGRVSFICCGGVS